MLAKDVPEFERYCIEQSKKPADDKAEEDAEKEEITLMEGFRYRVNDTCFPVYRGSKALCEFPIIPIGMLDVWRQEERQD